jgi:hypothetical protein
MKEEDEYIDSIISSAINSVDIDTSMLNSDWDNLRPLLVKKKKRRFLIIFFLVSPFIIYGAYSISKTEWLGYDREGNENRKRTFDISDNSKSNKLVKYDVSLDSSVVKNSIQKTFVMFEDNVKKRRDSTNGESIVKRRKKINTTNLNSNENRDALLN